MAEKDGGGGMKISYVTQGQRYPRQVPTWALVLTLCIVSFLLIGAAPYIEPLLRKVLQ